MPISVIAAGVLRPIKAQSVMVGGVLRKLKTIKVMRGGELVTVATYAPPNAQPLSAVASPSEAYGTGFGNQPSFVTSEPVTVIVTGGTAPFTYSCAIVSGVSMSITNPGSATTQFQKVIVAAAVATARWTITDSLGAVTTCDCVVRLEKEF